MTTKLSIDASAIRMAPLGLSLLARIQKAPLGAASQLHDCFGRVARLDILLRRIYCFFEREAAREILVGHKADFVRESRLLRILESFQGKNVRLCTSPGTRL